MRHNILSTDGTSPGRSIAFLAGGADSFNLSLIGMMAPLTGVLHG